MNTMNKFEKEPPLEIFEYIIESTRELARGTELKLHAGCWVVFPTLNKDELNLLLKLLETSQEKIIGKRVTTVSMNNTVIAIGDGQRYFRFGAEANSSEPTLLTLMELCCQLDSFNVLYRVSSVTRNNGQTKR